MANKITRELYERYINFSCELGDNDPTTKQARKEYFAACMDEQEQE